ncbi:MAG: DUF481 domain-containing protein [Bacteroidota bacterium]
MRRTAILIALSLCFVVSQAQVIDTETKRTKREGEGWTGQIDLGFTFVRNTNDIRTLTGASDINWTRSRNTLLLLNQYRRMQVNGDNIQNQAFQHVRFNHQLRRYLIPEAFVQAQYDQLWLIDLRVLAGAGPRFAILEKDSANIHFGVLMMYEYENITGGQERNRDVRVSTYLSGNVIVNEHFAANHITYYQPRIDDWSDFRISSSTNLRFTIIKDRLAFKTGLDFRYDSRPPEDLITTFLTWTNGLSLGF